MLGLKLIHVSKRAPGVCRGFGQGDKYLVEEYMHIYTHPNKELRNDIMYLKVHATSYKSWSYKTTVRK